MVFYIPLYPKVLVQYKSGLYVLKKNRFLFFCKYLRNKLKVEKSGTYFLSAFGIWQHLKIQSYVVMLTSPRALWNEKF